MHSRPLPFLHVLLLLAVLPSLILLHPSLCFIVSLSVVVVVSESEEEASRRPYSMSMYGRPVRKHTKRQTVRNKTEEEKWRRAKDLKGGEEETIEESKVRRGRKGRG